MTEKPIRLWPVLLTTAVAFALLCCLGVWQVKRLAWKEGLIAAIERNMAAAPQPFSVTQLTDGSAATLEEYRKLRLTGRYADQSLRMIATLNGAAGWRLLSLFETEDGARFLVDRGVAAEGQTPAPPAGVVSLAGLVRHHAMGQGMFDPPNNVSGNQWYWWDWPAMLAALPQNAMPTATFVLELLPGEPGTEALFVPPPKANLANNHLGYAITWFGFAAALLLISGLFIRAQMRKTVA
jgi:surfeit locus 1 family protein